MIISEETTVMVSNRMYISAGMAQISAPSTPAARMQSSGCSPAAMPDWVATAAQAMPVM